MFFKLSILVVATLAALATAASVPERTEGNQGNGAPHGINNDGTTQTCSTYRKCCQSKRFITDADVTKFGSDVNVSVGQDPVWVDCVVLGPQDATCTGLPVCCDKSAPDGSIAFDCKDLTA